MDMDAWVNGHVASTPAVEVKSSQQTHPQQHEDEQPKTADADAAADALPRHRRSMDIKDLLDDHLPSLSTFKDGNWMKKFTPGRKLFSHSPSTVDEEEKGAGGEALGNGGAALGRRRNSVLGGSPSQSPRKVIACVSMFLCDG